MELTVENRTLVNTQLPVFPVLIPGVVLIALVKYLLDAPETPSVQHLKLESAQPQALA
jgi:hypothetical protein